MEGTEISTSPPSGRRLKILETPEFRQAAEAIRSALERLHDQYAPIVERARTLQAEASAIEIDDEDSCAFADHWVKHEVMGTQDSAIEIVGPWTDFGNTIHKSFVALRSVVVDACKSARITIDEKDRAYRVRVEREKAERERLECVEREARERQAGALVAVETIHAQLSFAAECMERDRELADTAKEAEESGDAEMATALREQIGEQAAPPPLTQAPLFVDPPVVAQAPEVPKLKGTHTRDNWKHRIRDADQARRSIHERPEYWHLLVFDTRALDQMAKANRENLSKLIPGIEAWNDQGISRGRR